MTVTSFLTLQQIEEFNLRGVLFLEGLLSADAVLGARDYVRRRLAQAGLWNNGTWRLDEPQRQAAGLKTSLVIGNKHPAVEALIQERDLLAAVNSLLDGQPFDRKIHRRPQILFTLPNAFTWSIPKGWHVDIPRLASGLCPGLQMFGFLEEVGPRAGGTLVVAGSHLLFNCGRFIKQRELTRMLRRTPFFRHLYDAAGSPSLRDDASTIEMATEEDGAVLELVELTGRPGDVYLMDLRMLHALAPNASDRPRVMATHRFVRADAIAELASGFAWR
jgi:hypothetical protein